MSRARARGPGGLADATRILQAFTDQRRQELAVSHRLPRISVVIPSFNQALFIERTLLSVFNQNYPNLEIIVIDGGSKDGTVEVLERYRSQLAYVHSGSDKGQSDALNHGFSRATGDIFGWLNSDDVYLPGALRKIAEAFRTFPGASVVYGDWWSIDSDDRVTEMHYAFDFSLGHFMFEGFHLNSQAMFWSREAHRRFGEFDVGLHRTMDYDLIVRLGINEGPARFLRLQEPLACFRRHPAQKTTSSNSKIVADEHRLIAEKNGFPEKYAFTGRALRCRYRLRRAWWYLKRGGIRFTWDRVVRSLWAA